MSGRSPLFDDASSNLGVRGLGGLLAPCKPRSSYKHSLFALLQREEVEGLRHLV